MRSNIKISESPKKINSQRDFLLKLLKGFYESHNSRLQSICKLLFFLHTDEKSYDLKLIHYRSTLKLLLTTSWYFFSVCERWFNFPNNMSDKWTLKIGTKFSELFRNVPIFPRSLLDIFQKCQSIPEEGKYNLFACHFLLKRKLDDGTSKIDPILRLNSSYLETHPNTCFRVSFHPTAKSSKTKKDKNNCSNL